MSHVLDSQFIAKSKNSSQNLRIVQKTFLKTKKIPAKINHILQASGPPIIIRF
jgi:hypothetical protein